MSPRVELHGYGGDSVHPMVYNSSQPSIVESSVQLHGNVFHLKAIDWFNKALCDLARESYVVFAGFGNKFEMDRCGFASCGVVRNERCFFWPGYGVHVMKFPETTFLRFLRQNFVRCIDRIPNRASRRWVRCWKKKSIKALSANVVAFLHVHSKPHFLGFCCPAL